jgi:hypothetical protein
MTQQIKPKQCGKEAWYIPNQKGFVPEIGDKYWAASSCGAYRSINTGGIYDYAAIEAGNCFETEQEALDAFYMPVDPAPLNWDELCEIADIGEDAMVALLNCFVTTYGELVNSYRLAYACSVRRKGRLNFEANKYWRGVDELSAWIEQKKDIQNDTTN